MRKIFSLTIVMAILMLLSTGCGDSSSNSGETASMVTTTYQVYLDVTFEGNIFLNQYDVDVYFDDKEVGLIKHGKNFTYMVEEVPEGKYELEFYEDGNESANGRTRVTVSGDTTFKCTIHAKGSEIQIDEIETLDSIEGNLLKMADVVDMNLQDALDQLGKVSFSNVSSKSEGDDSIWDNSNWMVIEQNINPDTEIDKNEGIILTCIKTTSYINNIFADMTLADAEAKVTELGYSKISYKNSSTLEDMTSQVKEMSDDDAKDWKVSEAKDTSSDEKTFELSLVNASSSEVSNAVEKAEDSSEESTEETSTEIINITIDNNEDFAALMKITDPSDPLVKEFADNHKGEKVEFDGCVGLMMNHKNFTTRFDVLLIGGNYFDERVLGAFFSFIDVNYGDMKVSGSDTVAEKMSFHIIGTIGDYSDEGNFIELDPVSMQYRD